MTLFSALTAAHACVRRGLSRGAVWAFHGVMLMAVALSAGAVPGIIVLAPSSESEAPGAECECTEVSALQAESRVKLRRTSLRRYGAPLVREPASPLAGATSPVLLHAALGQHLSAGAPSPLRC